ncbi:hypothetical protein RFI_23229 [Reticulomyxa filosa]|uniref:Uncharacterized protein n=1 Tax=Reticulomyxa filosa TaxID=46433 RepID=X6MKF7_RETFI|nr:hypothetical protein RFI_23229 [Reticulomyxa filosa]|eukprot:ETO14136.1 hypothetical protein RFI_23229 [Reticulomyxa filosa]
MKGAEDGHWKTFCKYTTKRKKTQETEKEKPKTKRDESDEGVDTDAKSSRENSQKKAKEENTKKEEHKKQDAQGLLGKTNDEDNKIAYDLNLLDQIHTAFISQSNIFILKLCHLCKAQKSWSHFFFKILFIFQYKTKNTRRSTYLFSWGNKKYWDTKTKRFERLSINEEIRKKIYEIEISYCNGDNIHLKQFFEEQVQISVDVNVNTLLSSKFNHTIKLDICTNFYKSIVSDIICTVS